MRNFQSLIFNWIRTYGDFQIRISVALIVTVAKYGFLENERQHKVKMSCEYCLFHQILPSAETFFRRRVFLKRFPLTR